MEAGSYFVLTTGTLLTYFIRFASAYIFVSVLCFSLRQSRTLRLWLWRALLYLAVFFWLFSLIPDGSSADEAGAFPAAQALAAPILTWSLSLPKALTSPVAVLQSWLLLTYIVIALCLVVKWALQIFLLNRSFYDAEDPPTDIQILFRELCRELQVSSCRLQLSSTIASPCTAGWRRPYIVLPSELPSEIGSAELTNILRHELAHVRRRDYLWDRLASLACRVIWFHPAAWMLNRHMRRDCEFACDQAVTESSADRSLEYADCLVRMARLQISATHRPSGVIDFASSPSLLSERIHALLEVPPSPTFSNRAISVCFAATAFYSLLTVVPRLGVTFLSNLTPNLIAPVQIFRVPLTGTRSTVRTPPLKVARRHFIPSPTESQEEIQAEPGNPGTDGSRVTSIEELPAAPTPAISSQPQKWLWATHSQGELLSRQYSNAQTKVSSWQPPPRRESRVHLAGWRRAAVTAAAVAGSVLAQSLSDSPDAQQKGQHEPTMQQPNSEHQQQ